MKINKKQFNRWLIALYNEEYPQTTEGVLKDAKGYCCLGVGCELFIPKNKLCFENYNKTILFGSLPEDQKNYTEWLKLINDDFHYKTGCLLSELNDAGINDSYIIKEFKYNLDEYHELSLGDFQNEPFTHAELAMLLDLVYNYKILD